LLDLFGMFFNEQKAQISAEMIIVLAALIAIAVVLVTKLRGSVEEGSAKIDEKSNELFNEIDNIDVN
jgi:hypothetical protein